MGLFSYWRAFGRAQKDAAARAEAEAHRHFPPGGRVPRSPEERKRQREALMSVGYAIAEANSIVSVGLFENRTLAECYAKLVNRRAREVMASIKRVHADLAPSSIKPGAMTITPDRYAELVAAERTLKQVQDALDTQEGGNALVEVARGARFAEQQLALRIVRARGKT